MYDQIKTMLDTLNALQGDLADFQHAWTNERTEAIPLEVLDRLSQIDARWQSRLDGLTLEAAQLTEHIKALVLDFGQSVTGESLQAVFSNGRVSWEDRFMQGYAAAHPEIREGRIEGKPSVSIRKKR